MWPDLLNPVWPPWPCSLTWPHSFYSSQHALIDSTREKQWGEKESVCLNVLFQRSVSLAKHRNSQQWFPNCWNITSHLATAIISLPGIFRNIPESLCLCQQHLAANTTHSSARISHSCRKLLVLQKRVFGNFIHQSDRHCHFSLDFLGENREVSVCCHITPIIT